MVLGGGNLAERGNKRGREEELYETEKDYFTHITTGNVNDSRYVAIRCMNS